MADEQVGNNSWQTMTPGSAVAGQLQNILTQKRMEQRQALLDSLQAENVKSQIADRDENMAANRESRAATADWRKQQAALSHQNENDKYLNEFTSGQQLQDPATIAKIKGINPELLQQNVGSTLPSTQVGGPAALPGAAPSFGSPSPAQGGAPIAPIMQASPSQLDPSVPGNNTIFQGNGKQQADRQKLQSIELAKQKLQSPGFDALPVAQKAYWYEQATGHQPQVGMFENKSDQWVPIIGPDGTPTGNWAPSNAIKMGFAPKEPRTPDPAPVQIAGHDAKGNEVVLLSDHHGNIIPFKGLPDGVTIDSRPGAPAKPPKGVTDQTKTQFAAAKQAWLKNNKDAVKEDMLKQTAARLISEFPADPSVREKVQSMYNQPAYRNYSVDEFRNFIDDSSDPKNAQDAINLWQLLVQK